MQKSKHYTEPHPNKTQRLNISWTDFQKIKMVSVFQISHNKNKKYTRFLETKVPELPRRELWEKEDEEEEK